MSFHNSAQNIELDGTTLKAELANVEGEWIECELNLDDILGNADGEPLLSPPSSPSRPILIPSPPPSPFPHPAPYPTLHPTFVFFFVFLFFFFAPEIKLTGVGSFEWGGEGFSGSASDIEFAIEGDDNVPILRAKLSNGDGEDVDADVNLSERIGNNDGSFHFGEFRLFVSVVVREKLC